MPSSPPSQSARDKQKSPTNDTENNYEASRASRFRFKKSSSKRDRSPRSDDEHHSASSSHGHHRRYRRRHHHRRSKRHKHGDKDGESDGEGRSNNDAFAQGSLSPNAAFRESLFDALGDDEGASYWESVYGQPIHTYPSTYTGPTGELETMNEEEYTTFVRQKMWEKTHQHIIEERERREKVLKEEKERRRRAVLEEEEMRKEDTKFRDQVEEALRRGKKREEKRRWKAAWERYLEGWKLLTEEIEKARQRDNDGVERQSHNLQKQLPWPTSTSKPPKLPDDKKDVEAFYLHAPPPTTSSSSDEARDHIPALLKAERIRWHPDKIQHRYGGAEGVDTETLKLVTGVFQIIDGLLGHERAKAGKA